LEVSAVNLYLVINIELACFLDVNSTSFDIDFIKVIMDLVMHSCYSIEPFFFGKGGEFEDV